MQKTIYDLFPDFYQNKAIKELANTPRWTASTPDKIPINIVRAIQTKGKVIDNCYDPQTDCTDLYTITKALPNLFNHTFFLDCFRDHYVVLDIEPSCDEETKKRFLNLPYIYVERSMSGKGYHMIFRLPDTIHAYPEIKNKTTWRSEKKDYELLLYHTVTFTRNTKDIPPSDHSESFLTLFEELAKIQEKTTAKPIDISTIRPKEIPLKDYVHTMLLDSPVLQRTVKDYHDDQSSYEMAQITLLIGNLEKLLTTDELLLAANHIYTNEEKAWIIYDVLITRIPYRKKHDTKRANLPYLLYSISRGLGSYEIRKEEEQKAYEEEQKRKLKEKVRRYNEEWEKKQKKEETS